MQILRDWGIRSLDPLDNQSNTNGRPIGTGDLETAIGYLNGALEEAYNDGPASISQRPVGGVLRPQTAVTLHPVQYDTEIADAITGWQDWMIGCTIRIDGDAFDNELISANELARPYMGTGAAGTAAIVFGDCIPLPFGASHIISPVKLVGSSDLTLVGTRREFEGLTWYGDVWRLPGFCVSTAPSPTYNKQIGTPRWGLADTLAVQTGEGVPKYLRVVPLPAQAWSVKFTATMTPPSITADDVDDGDHTTDPGVNLPVDWAASVIVPIARQRASSDPLFTNLDGRGEILRQFSIARAILKGERPGILAQEGQYH